MWDVHSDYMLTLYGKTSGATLKRKRPFGTGNMVLITEFIREILTSKHPLVSFKAQARAPRLKKQQLNPVMLVCIR